MTEDAALFRVARREGIDLFRHVWEPPTRPYIEPLKDALGPVLTAYPDVPDFR